jgi:hypothetical protein
MCDFLTIALPAASQAKVSAWKRRDLHLSMVANASIRRQLPSGFDQWLVTSGGCSCALVRHDKQTPELVSLRGDILNVVEELLGQEPSGYMLVHVYSGDVATEEVTVTRGAPRSIEQLRLSEARIRCDELLPITSNRRAPNPALHRMTALEPESERRNRRKGRHR